MADITEKDLEDLELAIHVAVREEYETAQRLMESHHHALWQDAKRDLEEARIKYVNAFIAHKEQLEEKNSHE